MGHSKRLPWQTVVPVDHSPSWAQLCDKDGFPNRKACVRPLPSINGTTFEGSLHLLRFLLPNRASFDPRLRCHLFLVVVLCPTSDLQSALQGGHSSDISGLDKKTSEGSPVTDSPSRTDNRVDDEHSFATPVRGSPVLPSQDTHIDEEKGPLDHYLEPLEHILTSDPSDDSFQLLGEICDQIIVEGKSFLSIKDPASSVRSSQPGLDIQDPQTCQKLYRRNRRRAVREIVDSNCHRCDIPLQTLAQHFSDVWQGGGPYHSIYHHADEGRVDVIDQEFSSSEIVRALRSSENTAPGPDRLTNHHWRSLDPSAQVLTKIFNICLRHQKVPPGWKESTTILLPKDGDPNLLCNWRPIALSNTIYKLFMKCVSQRLKDWLVRYDVLSTSQKGFMPHDGVLEHNFIMHKRFEDARTKRKELCLAWLDVTNAFGAIPHCAIDDALAAAQVGISDFIPIGAGIKQGCPLSGLLFNLCVDPVLRSVRNTSGCHNVLAFADDIALLEDSPDSLQTSIDTVFDLLKAIGLKLNPSKSMSLHISGVTPVGARNSVFSIDGEDISSLSEHEFHKFLGKPIGFNPCPNYQSLSELADIGMKISTSALAPWQRIDALKSFLYPAFQFPMRTGQFKKTDWERVDKMLKKEIKTTLSLPDGASNESLWPQEAGLYWITNRRRGI
ncbi:retrovirus-related Pol polyprotein from type-1 retrotransposable element R2 [Caerostris darwini]|uniref:Retrovirus-related Pol polyprotein from type-1 retrotransposable element R2 n=1 Tax=Caerostris darwini TaxID=1538125 RepID=A0AAV4TLI6_9ARAC|nr:retrovirus-related Pol polyprotein from type-1 retrotransposable element R2 [Caerostris darwini]